MSENFAKFDTGLRTDRSLGVENACRGRESMQLQFEDLYAVNNIRIYRISRGGVKASGIPNELACVPLIALICLQPHSEFLGCWPMGRPECSEK